ncbi:DUF4760 domain-containing protein [Vibrio parahaemolyticus]|nr:MULTISPECIES: DUF4760 domain-containing protein [Vibrio]EGR1976126.1 DUF4760 domain-containing protein [Vibrio parahaemolyticus]EJG0875511.1 DUF4760 domain-containing protein [Vibrio parahaemolyticus O3]EJG0904141.1 DUF4760 domain-containing protein [Vibrio parahaemolyticus O3:K56]EJG1076970.1 DUF4760 domain-containing protein [Vibrio parahaemolyticus O1:K56]EXJ37115.1 hypothetical protein D049_5253 [Vibrio parahaemolyticus VPTS-2010]POC04376.1 DUF4760 domain-containing protein [Vibrio vul
MFPYEILDLTFSGLLAYVSVLAAFAYIRSGKQKKRTVSLEFIKRWNDGEYTKVFSNILADPENHNKDIREILYESAMEFRFSSGKSTQAHEVERIWNFFEELSIAILYDEADEELAKEFFLYSMSSTYRISEKALLELRTNGSSRGLYLNFERLFGKWTADKSYTVVREVSK